MPQPGLTLEIATRLAGIALGHKTLPQNDARAAIKWKAADDHPATSLPHIAGDYMGERWLGAFALLALEA